MNGALMAFAEQGFNGASMRDIAKRAGTSLSNLYNYFPSKEELLVAVLKDANDELLSRTSRTVAAAKPSATERLRAAVRAYVGFVVDTQPASVVALSELRYLTGERRRELVAARDETEALFLQIVDQGVASGEFGTNRPRDATRAVLLLCATVANWFRPDGELSREAVAEMQADFALALVEAKQR